MNNEKITIDVIGGADGPTAIFVSGNPILDFIIGAAAVTIIVLSVFIFIKKHKKKNNDRKI